MATTLTGKSILTPDEVNTYLLKPFEAQSLATQVATVVRTSSHSYRIPVPGTTPSVDWTGEGEEAVPSDMTFDEIVVTPTKLFGYVPITSELVSDSGVDAADVIGAGLAKDVARKVDQAFFGGLVLANPDAQEGLGSLEVNATADDVQGLDVTAYDSLDIFAEGISLAEGVDSTITSWVANPRDVLALMTLKVATGSQQTLLAGARNINGVPLVSSSAVPAGTIYGVPKELAVVVIREDVEMDTDKSVFWTSDRVAVRVRMRVGFGFPKPSGIVKITKSA